MNEIIQFTDAAAEHILVMQNKNPNAKGFRLSLKKTGCSGYAYLPDIIETIKPDDMHFVLKNGLNIYLDPACLDFIKNITVDYVEDSQMGIKQKRLVYKNPNEKNRCGCGESFTID